MASNYVWRFFPNFRPQMALLHGRTQGLVSYQTLIMAYYNGYYAQGHQITCNNLYVWASPQHSQFIECPIGKILVSIENLEMVVSDYVSCDINTTKRATIQSVLIAITDKGCKNTACVSTITISIKKKCQNNQSVKIKCHHFVIILSLNDKARQTISIGVRKSDVRSQEVKL